MCRSEKWYQEEKKNIKEWKLIVIGRMSKPDVEKVANRRWISGNKEHNRIIKRWVELSWRKFAEGKSKN